MVVELKAGVIRKPQNWLAVHLALSDITHAISPSQPHSVTTGRSPTPHGVAQQTQKDQETGELWGADGLVLANVGEIAKTGFLPGYILG